MSNSPGLVKVAALLGPTAVGKSRMATDLARPLHAEIISVDSMQVYRGMDIGTAKPGISERKGIPHHLLDVVDPWENYSVALYQQEARQAVEDILSRSAVPFLVGGTGLYFEAVVFDLRFPPSSFNDNLRKKLEKWAADDPEGLRKYLDEVDPDFVTSGDAGNIRRVIRAVEVFERTGVPFSHHRMKRGEHPLYFRYAGAVLDAPRRALYRAIDRRVEAMFEAGLVDEVKKLACGSGLSRTARQALGYKEVLDHLDMGISLEETITNIQRRSRAYAKRQLTWFKQVPGLRHFELDEAGLEGENSSLTEQVGDYLAEELKERE